MGSHHKGPPEEAAALDAYVKLMRASESVTSRSHAELPRGLTLAQFGVLEVLYHRGPLCASELAGKLLKSAGNLTLVVNNLERDGHVRRERDAADRRFVTIHLTTRGRAFIAGLFPTIAAAITRELNALTPAEQSTLGRLCRKLGRGGSSSA